MVERWSVPISAIWTSFCTVENEKDAKIKNKKVNPGLNLEDCNVQVLATFDSQSEVLLRQQIPCVSKEC